MAKLHQNISKYSLSQQANKKIFGKKAYDTAHFMGTNAVKQRDATMAAERAKTDAENAPVMPIADDEELQRAKRKGLSRRNRGRASTILGSDAETLG